MKRNIYISNGAGFSLLEMSLAVCIMTALLTYAIPSMYRDYLNRAGRKTALEMQNIQDAARAYFIVKGSWPSSINVPPFDLASNGFLPSTWSPVNPFGNSYMVAMNGSYFSVSTQVRDGAQAAIINRLPSGTNVGNTVTSSIPVPGASTTGFGPPSLITSGVIYQASTDGFIEGNVRTSGSIVGYDVYSDASSHPNTRLPECNQGSYSSGNGGYYLQVMVHCLIHKGNYYQFLVSNGQGYSVSFIPLGT